MSTVILFNKPFNVLSQFTDKGTVNSDRKTLSEYIDVSGVYAAGRLDKDSEGLLLLTNDGILQQEISNLSINGLKLMLFKLKENLH